MSMFLSFKSVVSSYLCRISPFEFQRRILRGFMVDVEEVMLVVLVGGLEKVSEEELLGEQSGTSAELQVRTR